MKDINGEIIGIEYKLIITLYFTEKINYELKFRHLH